MVVAVAAVTGTAMAAVGGWLIYTAAVAPAAGRGPGPSSISRYRELARRRLAGLEWRERVSDPAGADLTIRAVAVRSREVGAAVVVMALVGGGGAWLLFGGVVPALFVAAFSATFPVAAERRRIQARLDSAVEEWPRMLEEIRLRTGSLGRSVPQALFEGGRNGPEGWRPVFDAAEREWLLTVDFARTVAILKSGLSDPTADAVFETLLMAHEIGGTDLDTKLADLIEDRTIDLQSRRDANSRLAGVRFARRFVVVVPLGMAVSGLTIGTGRQAYETAGGQMAVVIALAAVAACWWWSGRLMRLPGSPRVFR